MKVSPHLRIVSQSRTELRLNILKRRHYVKKKIRERTSDRHLLSIYIHQRSCGWWAKPVPIHCMHMWHQHVPFEHTSETPVVPAGLMILRCLIYLAFNGFQFWKCIRWQFHITDAWRGNYSWQLWMAAQDQHVSYQWTAHMLTSWASLWFHQKSFPVLSRKHTCSLANCWLSLLL